MKKYFLLFAVTARCLADCAVIASFEPIAVQKCAEKSAPSSGQLKTAGPSPSTVLGVNESQYNQAQPEIKKCGELYKLCTAQGPQAIFSCSQTLNNCLGKVEAP